MTVPSLSAEMLAQISAAATSGQQYLQEWTQEHVSQPLNRFQQESQKWGQQWQAIPARLTPRQRKWVLLGLLLTGISLILVCAGIFAVQQKKTNKPALW